LADANLTRWQWRIVILGWVTYAAFYLGRVNLATALPAIEADLGWSPEQTSALAGAMLWTYAVGQLVNGWIGHYVDTRRMVFFGIVGSAFLNLLFALSSSLPVMIALWLINGFLQAMGWGPILRTLSDTLASDKRSRIAGVFGASYVVGNTVTWVLAGLLLSTGHWRLTFVIPPLLMLGIGIIWYRFSRPARPTPETRVPASRTLVGNMLREFWRILIVALVAGALFNGALYYAPSYVAQTLPLDQAAILAIIFPIFGLLGTAWLGSLILRRLKGDALRGVAVLLALAAFVRALAFVLPASTGSAFVLLASMGITSYALTNVLVTAIPLTAYSHLGTSIVAGIMDATHSIGGAIGSTMVGLLLARGDWPLVFGAWTLLPLLALAVISVAIRQQAVGRTDPKEQFV
jgi:OPA family glycerol-3-phosphate transporter-like MFS transporter